MRVIGKGVRVRESLMNGGSSTRALLLILVMRSRKEAHLHFDIDPIFKCMHSRHLVYNYIRLLLTAKKNNGI